MFQTTEAIVSTGNTQSTARIWNAGFIEFIVVRSFGVLVENLKSSTALEAKFKAAMNHPMPVDLKIPGPTAGCHSVAKLLATFSRRHEQIFNSTPLTGTE
jgi:hypothetical protein